jgi:hypothetical protein
VTENRELYIKDGDDREDNDGFQSDLVRLILNFPFLSGEQQKGFIFGIDGFDKLQNE